MSERWGHHYDSLATAIKEGAGILPGFAIR